MGTSDEPYLYKELNAALWRETACPEITALLDWLLDQEANSVVRVGYTNLKAPGTVAILEHAPSETALDRLREMAGTMPGINVVSDGIGCANHYCEVDWSAHGTSRPGLVRRIASWFANHFR